MKICPHCQTRYTDDSLQFCLQDAAILVDEDSPTSMPTVAFNDEQQTVVRNRNVGGTQFETQNYQQQPTGYDAAPRKSNTALAIIVTVLSMLLIFAIGIAGWLYIRSRNEIATNQSPQNSVQNSSKPTAAPAAKSSATPAANVTATTPSFDVEEAKAEVAKALTGWRAAAESNNLDEYMTRYAPTVDYYNKKGASINFVRNDKAKAFTKYNKINFDLSNMQVSIDNSGENAIIIADKEWHFEGEEKNSEGKVQQRISMKRINGDWKITGEKDLKVYYTR